MLAVAPEHGFASWAGLRRDIEGPAHGIARWVARIGPGTPERYQDASSALLRSRADGDERARRRVRAHVPRLARLARLDDAAMVERTTLSATHAWSSHASTASRRGRDCLRGLSEESLPWKRAHEHPESVAAALAAIRAGDAAALGRLLDAEPGLVHVEVGAGGSLSGRGCATGCLWSALSHELGVDRGCVDLLIERGSDLDGPLNLAACFDRVELVEILLAAGARVDERGIQRRSRPRSTTPRVPRSTSSPQSNSCPTRPGWLLALGASTDSSVPRRTRWIERRRLCARANPADVGWLHRLPARDMPQDLVDEALVHAAQNERPAAVAWLLERGANPDASPYQGCGALHLAAAFGAVESTLLLIAAGADINRRTTSTVTTPSAGPSTSSPARGLAMPGSPR